MIKNTMSNKEKIKFNSKINHINYPMNTSWERRGE